MRVSLSVFLAWMLFANSLPAKPKMLAALNNAQAPTGQKQTLKEKLLEIPVGSMVEIRLRVKEKLRGRLGEVSNEGFTVKIANGNIIEDRKLVFDEVKSIKSVEGSHAGRTVLYAAVGAVLGLLVVFAIAWRFGTS